MAKVLVPLDGSELAERALPLAAAVAHLTGSGLKLVEAAVRPTSLEVGMGFEGLLEAAQDYLNKRSAMLRERYQLHVTSQAVIASAVKLIVDQAARPAVSAVVMSTHGRTGPLRMLMGSVAEGVLRKSPNPVYLVSSRAPEGPAVARIKHILVPLDGSAVSYSVLAPVRQLAQAAGACLTLFRIFDEGEELTDRNGATTGQQWDMLAAKADLYFAPVKAHLRAAGLQVAADWTTGDPAREILAQADFVHADLVALATHGRSGFDRLRHGSVAEGVLRHAKVPVMTFGPAALKRLAGDVGTLVDARIARLSNL